METSDWITFFIKIAADVLVSPIEGVFANVDLCMVFLEIDESKLNTKFDVAVQHTSARIVPHRDMFVYVYK
jgi:hypothetical protein